MEFFEQEWEVICTLLDCRHVLRLIAISVSRDPDGIAVVVLQLTVFNARLVLEIPEHVAKGIVVYIILLRDIVHAVLVNVKVVDGSQARVLRVVVILQARVVSRTGSLDLTRDGLGLIGGGVFRCEKIRVNRQRPRCILCL